MDLDANEPQIIKCRRSTINACHSLSILFSVILVGANIGAIFWSVYLNLVYLGCASGCVSIMVSVVDIVIIRKAREQQCSVCRTLLYILDMLLIIGASVFMGFSLSWHLSWSENSTTKGLLDDTFTATPFRLEKISMHFIILVCLFFNFILIIVKLVCVGSMTSIENKNKLRLRCAYREDLTSSERVSAHSQWEVQSQPFHNDTGDHLRYAQHRPGSGPTGVAFIHHPGGSTQSSAPPPFEVFGVQPLPYNPAYVGQSNISFSPGHSAIELPPSYNEVMSQSA